MDFDFSFDISDEEMERLKKLLTASELKHYIVRTYDNKQLDVVEYQEYQKIEKENEDLKKRLEKKYEKVGTLTGEILYEENTRFANEITVLKTENQKLNEQIKIKHNGFMASVEEKCKLAEENQQLKKQLENCYCNRTDCSSRIRNSKQYDSLVQKTEKQQKKFIEYLEGYIATLENQKESVEGLDIAEEHILMTLEENLAKYKEIIGDNNGNEKINVL